MPKHSLAEDLKHWRAMDMFLSLPEGLNIAEFARRRGTDETTVRRWLRQLEELDQHVVELWDPDTESSKRKLHRYARGVKPLFAENYYPSMLKRLRRLKDLDGKLKEDWVKVAEFAREHEVSLRAVREDLRVLSRMGQKLEPKPRPRVVVWGTFSAPYWRYERGKAGLPPEPLFRH